LIEILHDDAFALEGTGMAGGARHVVVLSVATEPEPNFLSADNTEGSSYPGRLYVVEKSQS